MTTQATSPQRMKLAKDESERNLHKFETKLAWDKKYQTRMNQEDQTRMGKSQIKTRMLGLDNQTRMRYLVTKLA